MKDKKPKYELVVDMRPVFERLGFSLDSKPLEVAIDATPIFNDINKLRKQVEKLQDAYDTVIYTTEAREKRKKQVRAQFEPFQTDYVFCDECGWSGEYSETDNGKCPECGAELKRTAHDFSERLREASKLKGEKRKEAFRRLVLKQPKRGEA